MPKFQTRDPIFQKANYLQMDKNDYTLRHLRQVGVWTFNLVLFTSCLLLISVHCAPCSSQLFRFRSFLAMSASITLFQLCLFSRNFFQLQREQIGKQAQNRICAYSVAIITINSMFYMFFTFVFVLYLGHPLFVGPVQRAVEQAFFVGDTATATANSALRDLPLLTLEQALGSLLYYFPPFQAEEGAEVEGGEGAEVEGAGDGATTHVFKQLVAQFPVLYAMSVATVVSSMRAYSNLLMSCDAL